MPIKIFLTFWFLCAWSCLAQVTNKAVSASRQDVQDAVDKSNTGDTVVVPPGTNTWERSVVSGSKGIKIQGAAFYVYTASSTLSNQTGLNTKIIDGFTNRNDSFFIASWRELSGQFRLTGFEFSKGASSTLQPSGAVLMRGSIQTTDGFPNSNWRIDHCYFNKCVQRPMYVYAFAGVIDNCYIDQGGNAGTVFDGRIPDPNEKGHWSWATDPPYGTVYEGVYMENCYIRNNGRGCTDGFCGSRVVVRFCTLEGVSIENHGTESTGIYRGGRWIASYGNNFIGGAPTEWAHHYRSGSGVVFSNFVSTVYPGLWRGLTYRRLNSYNPWKGANGTNVWDQNDPVLYYSGTHTGGNHVRQLVDTNASFTANQWVGYSITSLEGIGTSGNSGFGLISANTATTITDKGGVGGSFPDLYWTNGNHYQIRFINRSLDAPGMGKGDLLSGGSNVPSIPPTPTTWPNEVDDPVYFWDNTGKVNTSNSGDSSIVNGRNYTNAVRAGYVPLTFPHPWAGGAAPPPAPSAPTNLTVTVASATHLSISWTDTSTNETAFLLERSLSSGSGFQEIVQTAPDVTTYDDLGLDPNTTYYYRVRAANGTSVSPYSAVASGTTPPNILPSPVGRRINFFIHRKQFQ